MATIVRDVAKSIHWGMIISPSTEAIRSDCAHGPFRRRAARRVDLYGRALFEGRGLSLAIIKACVPVDGDTYDVPAIIATAEARWKAHVCRPRSSVTGEVRHDPEKHRDFSAVTHVARDKGIPPFLILHVAGHPDTTAQALRLGNVLKDAGVPATVFARKETTTTRSTWTSASRAIGHQGVV